MLLINPRILYWDASFQLSFLATLGIVYLAPLIEQLTEQWPSLIGIKSQRPKKARSDDLRNRFAAVIFNANYFAGFERAFELRIVAFWGAVWLNVLAGDFLLRRYRYVALRAGFNICFRNVGLTPYLTAAKIVLSLFVRNLPKLIFG